MDPATEKPDFGDTLSPEQEAAAKAALEKRDTMTDDEVSEAVKAMTGEPETKPDDETKEKTETKTKEEKTPSSSEKADDEQFIPKGRFDEAVGKQRDRADKLEEQLNQLKEQVETPKPAKTAPNIDTQISTASGAVRQARQDWTDAILDNDSTKAKALLKQIGDAEDYLDALRLEKASAATRAAATEDVSFDQRLTQLEKEFPVLDQNSEDYDEKLDNKLTRLFNGLVNGGATRVDALNEAAEVYLQPTASKKTGDKKEETEQTLRDKAKETLKETLDKQPPEVEGKTETKTPALLPSRLTPEQYGDLPEEQKAILRGDVV